MKKFLFAILILCSIVTFAGNRCSKYNIGDTLPAYVEKNGYMVPASPANFSSLGILVRVDAVPEAGKVIVKSHGELINGQWSEVIDEQKTPEEIKNAQALLKSKFTKLQIRRALRTLGQEAALDILLADDNFKKDWADAIEINLNDSKTKQALTSLNVDINAVKIAISNLE